jgi:hypothetical protein
LGFCCQARQPAPGVHVLNLFALAVYSQFPKPLLA